MTGGEGTSVTLISKLDIGDPLFLHPSDSSALTIVSMKLKGTENYSVWSSAMKLALEAKNKFGFINGKCVKPKDNEVLAAQWDRCNSVVLTWLLNSISDELFLGQVFSKLASEVWTDLKETYDKVDGSVVYDLYKKINCISQNGSSVAEYYNKLTTMWKQFDAMVQLPSCSCQAAKNYNDFTTLIKLMQFLMGLDDVYQPVRTNLLTREPFPSVKAAFALISREESHRLTSSSSKSQSVSYVAKSNPPTQNTFRRNFKGSNSNLKCTHCNMLGHTVDRCFEIIGYPPGMRKRNTGQFARNNNSSNNVSNNKSGVSVNSSSSVGSAMPFTSEQIAKLLDLVSEKSGGEQSKANMGGELDLKSKKILVIGKQENGLYMIGRNGGKSPYECMFGFKPSLEHLRNFGCLCFSTILNESDKFAYHADKCVLIGYSNTKKGYKLWSLDEKKVFFSRDVKFYEHVYPFKSKFVTDKSVVDKGLNHINFFDSYEMLTTEFSQNPNDEEGIAEPHGTISDDQQPVPSTSATPSSIESSHGLGSSVESSVRMESGRAEDTVVPTDEVHPSEGSVSDLRRSSRNTVLPKRFDDFVLNSNVKYDIGKVVSYNCLSAENYCFTSKLNKLSEPSSFGEASKDSRWVDAMNLEMEALLRNNTWEIVDLPVGRKPIGCKWIYKIKYKANGEVERYKARLVAKGYSQREGLDFGETFSPVVKMVTVRCVLSIAVQNGWTLFQLDVNNAFLYGAISEDVYMTPPEGYFTEGKNKVCKLIKSLYGLKQAPRKWNEKLTSVLLSVGFVQSVCDHSLYTLSKGSVFIILLVYVDDIVITGNNNDEIGKIKQMLSDAFHIKDLGILKYFLGIEVLYGKHDLCLSQRKYCLELLSEYGYLGCKPVSTPIELSSLVNSKTESNTDSVVDTTNYQKLVGKLIYLSLTRPDISYAVQFLSQFMHSPTEGHLRIALRLLRYLKSSPGLGIVFKKGVDLLLTCYADSDWAKCLVSRKSVTGFCVFLGSNLVSWKSKKQSTVSRSSGEAEYRSMCSATCELVWLVNILSELKVNCKLPIQLFCDSNAAISIAANPVFHERTKHFEIDLYFLREKISSGFVKTEKIDAEGQLADVFTKGLNVNLHSYFCEKLGLADWFKPNG
ncbi:putative RNA-directed DNA polymerase [Helianthus annuus]|nr:putative RNA-directed DNA polymerase [Helianthus annuus]KAJ0680391.1 putative RNA-directed DNA polymerase [Helianthus annuus]